MQKRNRNFGVDAGFFQLLRAPIAPEGLMAARVFGSLAQAALHPHITIYGLAAGARYCAVVGEIVVPFRTASPRPATEARSTLIVSGIQTLRANGLYDRYVDLLSPRLRQEIMSLVAGVWIPSELALEHYRTMDRLQLSKSAIEAIGAEVAERGSKTVLGRGSAGSKHDRTPWGRLVLAHRNLDNNWRGSDMMIMKEGPSEATFVWAGQPCASVPYFVTSWGAFLRSRVAGVCTTANHRVVHEQCSATTIVIHLSWV